MFSNPHNCITPPETEEKRYGIRVSLAGNDPFRRLLADDWETFHWFAAVDERNAALADMRRRDEFSRMGDAPTVQYEPVEK